MPTPVCFCKRFSCKACPGIFQHAFVMHRSCMSQSLKKIWCGAKQPHSATHRQTKPGPEICKSIEEIIDNTEHLASFPDAVALQPEWNSDARAVPERSPSGAPAEPQQSRGPRKQDKTPKGHSEAGAEPKWSPSKARKHYRSPKGVHAWERALEVPKLQ